MAGDALKGQVAVVTGAAKRIGRDIALRFAREGADVVVNYEASKSEAESVVAEIVAMGRRSLAVQGNVAHREDVQRLFRAVESEFGQLEYW